MALTAVAKVSVDLKRDDGSIITLREGDIVRGLTYKSGLEEKTVDGAVRVIVASTKANTTMPANCPPDPYLYKYITVGSLVIDRSAEFDADLIRISVSNIIDVESVETEDPGTITVGSGPQFKPLSDVIAEAPAGATISLQSGTYEAPLTIDKSLRIVGGKDVVISGPITLAPPQAAAIALSTQSDSVVPDYSISIAGVTLTGDALITVNTIEGSLTAFSMTDCTFGGHNLTAKTMPINIKGDAPLLLTITGCQFEAENEFSYNLIECNAKLVDGSEISNNVFLADCCTHNQISLYGLMDKATLVIDNNHADYSANMIRIGFKGKPVGNVLMRGNSYDTTDESGDGAWAGLFLVQPYSTKTESFAGVHLEISDTKKPEGGQIGYLYAGAKDTPWTADNKPSVIVDGKAWSCRMHLPHQLCNQT